MNESTSSQNKGTLFSWREGRFFDLWSIVHVFSGSILGLASLRLSVDMVVAFVVSLGLLILYEGIEIALNIKEHTGNIYADIVLGSVGFLISATLFGSSDVYVLNSVLGAVLAINCVLAWKGWRHYVRRQHDKKTEAP